LRDLRSDLESRGARLLAIDPHEPARVRRLLPAVTSGPGEAAFPVLADAAGTVSATYGVAFQMNIHTEWSNRPATFILDRQGILRYEHRGTTLADRPSAEQVLGELDRLLSRQGTSPRQPGTRR
jgi:peroxiredoxin